MHRIYLASFKRKALSFGKTCMISNDMEHKIYLKCVGEKKLLEVKIHCKSKYLPMAAAVFDVGAFPQSPIENTFLYFVC